MNPVYIKKILTIIAGTSFLLVGCSTVSQSQTTVSNEQNAELEIEKEIRELIKNSKTYVLKKRNTENILKKTELLLTRAISRDPLNARLFSARAKLYADQNKSKLAAKDYFSFSELDLESDIEINQATIAWMDGAAAQVLAEDIASYQNYCLNMFLQKILWFFFE